jgi:hypothetical protein
MKKAISINTFLIAILTLLISEQSFSQVTQQWVSRYNGAEIRLISRQQWY